MSSCEFCHKVLLVEKGEEDHGCLDCTLNIYIINDVEVCFHCLENENKRFRNALYNISQSTYEANPWTIVPSKEAIIAKAALEKKESR